MLKISRCTESVVLHRFGPNKFDARLSVGIDLSLYKVFCDVKYFKGFKLFSEKYVSRVELTPHSAIVVQLHNSALLKVIFHFHLF